MLPHCYLAWGLSQGQKIAGIVLHRDNIYNSEDEAEQQQPPPASNTVWWYRNVEQSLFAFECSVTPLRIMLYTCKELLLTRDGEMNVIKEEQDKLDTKRAVGHFWSCKF